MPPRKATPPVRCIVCDKLFGYATKSRPYCTRLCKNIATQEKSVCLRCNGYFHPNNAQQVYCGKKCANNVQLLASREYRNLKNKASTFTIFERDNFKCVYCGASAHKGATLHVDHIYPQSYGGGNDVFNLVSSCSDCNVSKGDRPFTEAKTIELWARNKQLDIKFGVITSYDCLVQLFDKNYPKAARKK